ncbi:MAG: 16S rRNA (adenine(1518)-N(6)/adenine(1519)-N(6))-dimethyltransferase RsmA [Methylococcales bacterium]|jgi:16S rRNA (adenine1518-N6/adenine1519-N6)-dimethyltransferase|nr:16S rRNA (adenine(1518)-N(6)/adenine(1519)-N(6))-dimethyltransferase RsmA [Methylococcales bacterium]
MTHQARKRFGQNFLHDHNIINTIIASAMISAGQHWVEIGAGQGALTSPLLTKVHHLDVVELDRDLVVWLNHKFANQTNLTIHSADALRFDFSALAPEGQKLHVIGNLPYNISTPLMFHLLENTTCIADMLFMLQKEVVNRICAEPSSKSYGRLSVMMQYYCATEWLFDVPPESFSPVPAVMSSIVRLVPHVTPPVRVDDMKTLNRVVTESFSQRRKTLRNSLKKSLSENEMTDLGIDANLRAENITLAEFAKLSNAVSQKSVLLLVES